MYEEKPNQPRSQNSKKSQFKQERKTVFTELKMNQNGNYKCLLIFNLINCKLLNNSNNNDNRFTAIMQLNPF